MRQAHNFVCAAQFLYLAGSHDVSVAMFSNNYCTTHPCFSEIQPAALSSVIHPLESPDPRATRRFHQREVFFIGDLLPLTVRSQVPR